MNGHALSGSRKLNHHWQSGAGGNFAPLSPWYSVQAINIGIGYSVKLSDLTIDFPVVYRMPGEYSAQDTPIIGIVSPLEEDEEPPTECKLRIRKTDKAFSKVIVTIKEKRNKTGIDWYIGRNFECIYREDGYLSEDSGELKADITGTKATWYSESPRPITGGKLSTLGCAQQDVYKLKDGVQITFTNTSGKWKLFELEDFECYYVWDPEITSTQKSYNSSEADKFIKVYNDATKGGVFNTKVLNNLWRWQVFIKAV